ncbi:MAG: hypothetical protein RLZZ540_757, partial [Bacteroidota bacterium]
YAYTLNGLNAGANYSVTLTGSNTFAINKRAITVSADAGQSKIYGSVNPTYTYTSSPTVGTLLANGHSISFTGSLTRVAGENVGEYAIQQGSLNNDNYNITYNGANFSITPLAVTVIANSGQTKVYGNANPASYNYTSSPASGSGLPNGHIISFSGAQVRVAGETVGNYAITQGTLNNTNYDITYTGANFNITQRPISITVNSGQTKIHGTADPLPFTYTVGGSGLAPFDEFTGTLIRATGENVASYAISQGALSIRNNTAPNASAISNYNVAFTGANFTITQASTITTLTLSAESVRYMDNLTYTAVIKPLNTATPLTGSVKFDVKVGTNIIASYTANVVPIPGSVDGSVQAMVINQLPASVIPGNYSVTATFTSTNLNYSGSTDSKTLTVIPRSASYLGTGYYTGDEFVWTPTETSSTGTVALVATIKDANTPGGDVRGAKVTFYYVNSGVYTAISGATNLPVGLVNISDGSIGTASAIVQLNIGSQNSASYTIAVGITGAYINKKTEPTSLAVVTVSKPIPGGYVVAGGNLLNSASSGILKGATGVETAFSMDVKFNNKMTNPQGKSYVTFWSYYLPNGTLDSQLHHYEISSNAIAVFAVGQTKSKNDASFSSKSNLVEVLENGTVVGIESGITLQLTMTDNGKGTTDLFGITLQSKNGGVWFSSNWNVTKTQEQLLNGGNVYVSTSGLSQTAKASTSKTENINVVTPAVETVMAEKVVSEPTPFDVIAYPNPSNNQFTITLEGGSDEKVSVQVFDFLGKLIKIIEKSDGQPIVFGEELPLSVYIAIVTQGDNRKTIKLIKQ